MTKYLVFGDGLLGTAFKQLEDTVVLSRLECDITNKEDIERTIDEFDPEVVINTAGIVPKNDVLPEVRLKVNAHAPHVIAEICRRKRKFVHISTNCVFNGLRANYSERDVPNPLDEYGKSKLLGEPKTGLVIRTSFVGLPDPKGRGLLAWVEAQEKQVIGYDRVLWNGVTTLQLIKKIEELVDLDVAGIRHIHGHMYSKYDILDYANTIFGWGLDIIKESSITDTPHIECKTLMSNYKNGYIKMPIEKQLEELIQYASEKRNRITQYAFGNELAWLRASAKNMGTAVMIGAGPGIMGMALMEGDPKLILKIIDISTCFYAKAHMEDEDIHNVTYEVGDSSVVGKTYTGPEIDFLLVDGDHSKEGVLADIDAWFEHVRPGGILFFRDYVNINGDKNNGVAEALNHSFRNNEAEPIDAVGVSLVYRKST